MPPPARGGTDLHRAEPGSNRHDGRQGRGAAAAERNGVPVVPGSQQGFTDAQAAAEIAESIGYPMLLEGSGGGGGRGMRVVSGRKTSPRKFAQAALRRGRVRQRPRSILSGFSPAYATSKSRCSATVTATTSNSASAIAASSAAIRSWSRRRRRRCSIDRRDGRRWRRRRLTLVRALNYVKAPAPSNSSTTWTAGASSSSR